MAVIETRTGTRSITHCYSYSTNEDGITCFNAMVEEEINYAKLWGEYITDNRTETERSIVVVLTRKWDRMIYQESFTYTPNITAGIGRRY